MDNLVARYRIIDHGRVHVMIHLVTLVEHSIRYVRNIVALEHGQSSSRAEFVLNHPALTYSIALTSDEDLTTMEAKSVNEVAPKAQELLGHV